MNIDIIGYIFDYQVLSIHELIITLMMTSTILSDFRK